VSDRRSPDSITLTYDLLKWAIPTLKKFPRDQRFLLGDRIENHIMDDFVIFDNSKIVLREIRQKIIEYLEKLRLKVHLNKAQIWPVAKGTDWLGYRVYPTHRLVRRSNIRKFRRRFQHLAKAYTEGGIQLEQIKPSVMSWIGHVRHADSYGLRKKIFGEVSFQRG
jgi:hypothetical protein